MLSRPTIYLRLPLFQTEADALQRISDDLQLDPRESMRFILRGEAARRGIPVVLPRVGSFSKPSKLSESITPNLKRAVCEALQAALANDPKSKTILFKNLLPEVNRRLKGDESLTPKSLGSRLRAMGFNTQARRGHPHHNYGELIVDDKARQILGKETSVK